MFAGREWDGATGLYYYRAKYYSPEIGRFISEDPIGLVGGINMYACTGNNPRDRGYSIRGRSFSFLAVMIFVIFLLSPVGDVAGKETSSPHMAKYHWTYLGGYGVSHPGWGYTEVKVETLDFVLRYGRFLTDNIGSSWYKGRHGLLIEFPIRMVINPDESPMVGINFLACWTFTSTEKIIPYLFAGGGLLYTDADIPGLSSNLNGNYQGGIGMYYKTERGVYLNMEYRAHPISNAGTKEPNIPLNSSRFLIGVTFFH